MLPQVIEMKPNQVGIWERQDSLKEIKEIYGKGLSNAEFDIFVGVGKATGLSPFLREIWAVKYGNNPAQIFVGRDGYRKSAQRQTIYDYHLVDSVYSNDNFKVENGVPLHHYNLKDRGDLIGSYCVVKRKGAERPMFTFVELREYTTNKSLWSKIGGKPATMIKKVAEAQGLRQAFQELFGGTYHEYENWNDSFTPQPKLINKGMIGLKQRLGIEPANTYNSNLATLEQVEELRSLVTRADLSQELIQRWLDKANAKTFEEMPEDCILKCVNYLKKKEEAQHEL